MAESGWTLVVHGGAGLSTRRMAPEVAALYEAGLAAALHAGARVLACGGAAVDAVEAAVRELEDCEAFNAGRGAVLTAEGHASLDASIMCSDGATGAVAGIETATRNPISLARLVMERSEHVLLAGRGAEAFALAHGLEPVDNSYFVTDARAAQRATMLARDANARAALDHAVTSAEVEAEQAESKAGTVGAVARDVAGRLAAATSTGGMSLKRFGRVGDSPIVGAGTWADARVAVSCTGHGEEYIRRATAHDVAAFAEYTGATVADSARRAIFDKLPRGAGGLIAVDAAGEPSLPFSTAGMFRGWARCAGGASAVVAEIGVWETTSAVKLDLGAHHTSDKRHA